MATEWSRIVAEEVKVQRFCPFCGKTVILKFREYKFPRILFSCPVCGETILVKEKQIAQRPHY
ncbi:MAG: hypothetical protein ACTSPK_11165 [Candidatus Heimdallarchaeota archaeon]